MKKTAAYLLLFLLIIELILPEVVPLKAAYDCRMNYTVVKDNPVNIDVALDQIKHQIDSQDIKDYLIILGDSVAHSGPGPADESIGARLQEYYEVQGQKKAVFNLAMPAMQTGDIYTMILKLDEQGISTDNLIINLVYAGFAERTPDPPVVFWLQRDLARLDPASFKQVTPQLAANGKVIQEGPTQKLNRLITERLAVFRYKDFIKADLQHRFFELTDRPEENALGDPRPWYQKKGLKKLLETPEYQRGFAVKPFDMSQGNPQIYFLEKIIKHQQGKNTLVFMAPVNCELVPQVNDPGYQSNLQTVRDYFAVRHVTYIDFHGLIDQRLFSDHVHLIGPGYSLIAQRLGEESMAGEN
jgi:hypothetical protein